MEYKIWRCKVQILVHVQILVLESDVYVPVYSNLLVYFFKIEVDFKNLFQELPVFQLQFGQFLQR